MSDTLAEILKKIFGFEHTIGLTLAMTLRGLALYVSTIFFIRVNKRFFGVRTPTNFILFIMLGSIFASAVTGASPFLPIILTVLILMLINKAVVIIFFKYPEIEALFVGTPVVLIDHGKIQWSNMRRHHITENNLINALQTQLHTNDFSKIEMAYLATDGTINFIVK